jgi:hypothetical protein
MGRNNNDFSSGAKQEALAGQDAPFDADSFFTKENFPHMVTKKSITAEGTHMWRELPDGRKSPRVKLSE